MTKCPILHVPQTVWSYLSFCTSYSIMSGTKPLINVLFVVDEYDDFLQFYWENKLEDYYTTTN